jgi:ferredoxin-type protein NapG
LRLSGWPSLPSGARSTCCRSACGPPMAGDRDAVDLGRRALLRGSWRQHELPGPIGPPGAVEANLFHDRCTSCGDCAEVCPADAIVMTASATRTGVSSPEIHASKAPCVMWEGLVCTTSCPADALAPTSAADMKIANLRFRPDACWAATGSDPSCDYCFDRCPQKGRAVTYVRGKGPSFHPDHCSGCGVCAFYCPSNSKPLSLAALTT